MTYDRTEAASLVITMSFHLLLVLLFSTAIIKSNPRKVALITDVTLIDVKDYRGEKGEEEKTAGVEKKQKKLAETLEKKEPKKTEKKESVPDVKELLAKIEREKAKLDMGITKESLRSETTDEEIKEEQAVEEVPEEELLAGSDPTITGQIAARKYKKIEWKFPRVLPEETELMIEITVLSSGIIKNVKLVRTSGYPELDRLALSQARKLQFDPLPLSSEEQVGVLLFKFGAEK